MERTKKSALPTSSDSPGWVLIYALIFIAIIQATVMASTSILLHQAKITTAFQSILQSTHESPAHNAPPAVTQMIMAAPEGWDHATFSTEVLIKTWGKRQTASWRVALREQPALMTKETMLSSARTYVIILIDDSTTMNTASWMDYDPEGIYLQRPSGEIVRVATAEDISSTQTSPSGTYFNGSYGNTFFRAPPADGLTGAMPRWTWVQTHVRNFIDEVDASSVAIATVSGGLTGDFSSRRKDILTSLDHVHPTENDSRLAETLYTLTGAFPDEGAPEKHIIVITDGVAINDGDLPAWLQDFDLDGDPWDRHVSGAGSRCLDDVAAYASSIGIHVHTMGPDTTFLRNTAHQGGGLFMPTREDIVPVVTFASQVRTPSTLGSLSLLNRHARFDPPWLAPGTFPSYRIDEITPQNLCSDSSLYVRGPLSALGFNGSSVICSSLQDCLFSLHIPTRSLSWMIRGVGGNICLRGGKIITGPNARGMISCLSEGPELSWMKQGDLMDASESSVYLADGQILQSIELNLGTVLCEFQATHTITALKYDPRWGKVLAGTHSGLVYLFDQDLSLANILVTSMGEPVIDLRVFTWHKKPLVVAVSASSLCCLSTEGILWAAALEPGIPLITLVMDSEVRISQWDAHQPLSGLDSGRTRIITLDALTGEMLSSRDLSSGRSFGPLIDLNASLLEYLSWDGHVHQEDISSLKGMRWEPLGTRLVGINE